MTKIRLNVFEIVQKGWAVFFLLAVVASPGLALEEISPVDTLLKRMADASRQLSYRGLFTYEHGGSMKTIKVIHSVRDGREYERLVHLSGPKREVIRRGNKPDCQRMGDMLLRGAVFDVSHSYLADNYDFYVKGNDRVAGRDVTVVHVVPKDEFRYGYALSLDKETGLMLQSMLIGSKNRVLERFQFIDIQVGILVDDTELEPTDDDHYVAGLDSAPCVNEDAEPKSSLSQWRAAWLPPGFTLAGQKAAAAGRDEEVMVFTDGLAVFSVFIGSDEVSLPEVQAQRGATVAFLTKKGIDNKSYAICVVGEIPAATAKQVAQAISLLQ